jgi:2-polyprenyl-3-methyl-5-hydroxy-6-metoxy-1,4-benzoquinol methylase
MNSIHTKLKNFLNSKEKLLFIKNFLRSKIQILKEKKIKHMTKKKILKKHDQVGAYWSLMQTKKRPKLSWLELSTVNQYVNQRVTGHAQKHYTSLLSGYKKKFNSVLIVGCGNGQLERDLFQQGIFKKSLGVDIAEESIKFAQAQAKKLNLKTLSYKHFNLETENIKQLGKFDLVIISMVAHHIKNLNIFFRNLNQILLDDGILVMDEYVGPNRFKMNEDTIYAINNILDVMPMSLKKDFLPRDQYRLTYSNATEEDFQKSDPSEAINSENIEKFAFKNLHFEKKINYGGNLTHMLFNGIAENFNEKKYLVKDYLKLIMRFEELLEHYGIIRSDFAVYFFKKKYKRKS